MRTAPAACLLAIVLTAGAAGADIQHATGLEIKSTPTEASMGGPLAQSTIDLSGHAHFDVLGSKQNNILHADYAQESLRLTGISWDLSATTFSNIPLSELRIAIFNEGGEGIMFTPFAGLDAPGSGHAASSFYDLEGMGMGFDLGAQGVYIELYFDRELAASSEGVYGASSFITLELSQAPAPGTLGLLGAGALLAPRRRRR